MTRPAPDPLFVLRGHAAEISTIAFVETELNNKVQEKDTSDNSTFINDKSHVDISTSNVETVIRLVSGDVDGYVFIWNLPLRRRLISFKAHNKGILSASTVRNGSYLVTQGRDSCIQVYDMSQLLSKEETTIHSTVKPVLEIAANTLSFCKVSTMENDKGCFFVAPSLISGTHVDLNLLTFDTPSCKRLVAGIGYDEKDEFKKLGSVMCLELLSNETLLVGYESGDVLVWPLAESIKASMEGNVLNEKIKPLIHYKPHSEPVLCCKVKHGIALSGSAEEKIATFPLSKRGELNYVQIKHKGVADLAIRPDDRIFASAGWDRKVRIFNKATLQPLAILRYHRQGVTSVAFSSNKWLASGSKDHRIAIWEIYK